MRSDGLQKLIYWKRDLVLKHIRMFTSSSIVIPKHILQLVLQQERRKDIVKLCKYLGVKSSGTKQQLIDLCCSKHLTLKEYSDILGCHFELKTIENNAWYVPYGIKGIHGTTYVYDHYKL